MQGMSIACFEVTVGRRALQGYPVIDALMFDRADYEQQGPAVGRGHPQPENVPPHVGRHFNPSTLNPKP